MSRTQLIKAVFPASIDFAQRIAGRYGSGMLITARPFPLISTKRYTFPLNRWLELFYAMPFVVLRREIINSIREIWTTSITQPIEKLWNITLQFTGTDVTAQYGNAFSNIGKSGSRNIIISSRKSESKLNKIINPTKTDSNQFYFLKSSSMVQPASGTMISKHEFSERGGQRTERTTNRDYAEKLTEASIEDKAQVTREQPSVARHLVLATTPQLASLQPVVLTHGVPRPQVFSQATYQKVLSDESEAQKESGTRVSNPAPEIRAANKETPGRADFSYLSFVGNTSSPQATSINRFTSHAESAQPQVGDGYFRPGTHSLRGGKSKTIYDTFPAMETAAPAIPSVQQPLTEKEEIVKNTGPLPKLAQQQKMDLDRVADEVYRLIERKIRIERERRGL